MLEEQPKEPQILMDSSAQANVNRTSDYAIAAEALEIRLRPADESTERTELDDFLREQGFEAVELGA